MSLDRLLLEKRHSESAMYKSQIVLSRHMTVIPVHHQSRSDVKVNRLTSHSQRSHSVGYPEHICRYGRPRVYSCQDQKQTSLKRLSDIQNSPDHRAPEQVMPETPVPDYGDAATPENQNVFKFAQKFQTVLTNIQKIEDMYNDNMEPEPDYNDEADVVAMDTINANKERTPSQSSDDGIIVPKKLPNPCVESPTRQALHKELLLNYKRGVNVLEKPELNKVLQNRRETQRRKEWQEQASSKRTSLEMKLEQRATRLKEDEMKTITEKDESEKPELQKAFAKFAQKSNGNVK
ncbi:uncharacterized protein LOC132741265 isoform X2 [Ruditapes philippinarum]|uniref:uncharacterized protein LOC132741265 isoform X2 n=1 Tax=Ruditapes philippinarum TaxID=129788 RepID=UPI00295B01D7|nr:uncharacterized protein LOC132741265 isoform X2 [Ruditapes philippinarum]